jgi:hypothetical protein
MASNITDRANGFNSSTGMKIPVIAATTADITLSAAQTIDGIAVVAEDRVLVKDQTDTTENGLYEVATGAWTRAPDFDGSRDVVTGTTVFVATGTANGGEYWYVSTSGDPDPGDAMAFTQAPLAGAASAAIDVSFSNTASGLTAATAQAALDELAENYLLPKGTPVASATSTEIGAADSSFVSITGTTTITSFGSTGDRDHMWLQFDSALTLTHDGTKLILPSSANITTAAGDALLAIRVSGENWKVPFYQKQDGNSFVTNIVNDTTPQLGGALDTNSEQINLSKGADVASATALTLGTDGNYFDITGTTTVTSIATLAAGTTVRLHFDDAVILTHHATNLILPGAANITTAAGDEFEFTEYATGTWRCTGYVLASGKSVTPGSIVQFVETSDATSSSNASQQIPVDDTIPQNTEGVEAITLAITPTSATNKLRITAQINLASSSSNQTFVAALFQDSTANALQVGTDFESVGSNMVSVNVTHIMVAGTTSSTTFKVRGASESSSTITLNGASGSRLFGGVLAHTLAIEEIKV